MPELEQLDMFLSERNARQDEIDATIEILRSNGGWMTAASVLRALGLEDTESNRRRVRRDAEESEGLIISGQKGYRHLTWGTADEIEHCAAWLKSQGKKMLRRGILIQRRAHGIIG